jgi:hypothetical protein
MLPVTVNYFTDTNLYSQKTSRYSIQKKTAYNYLLNKLNLTTFIL